MYRIKVLETALTDVEEIGAYITVKLKSPMAAESLVNKIWDCIETLEKDPYIYESYFPQEKLRREYRKMLVDNYFVFYYVKEKEKTIVISRVIYAKRNLSRQIKE